MSRGEVVKTGYLTKSPPERMNKVAQWHRRWFVLSDSHRVYPLAKRYVRMEYYQSEDDTKKMKDPKGRRPGGGDGRGAAGLVFRKHCRALAYGHQPSVWLGTCVSDVVSR